MNLINLSENQTQCPGLDTLEEDMDKNRFFAELEQGKNTPINYSELNRKLSETTENDSSSQYNYQDDFESLSTHDTSSTVTKVTGSSVESESGTSLHRETETHSEDKSTKLHRLSLSPVHTSDVKMLAATSADTNLSRNSSSEASDTETESSRSPPIVPTTKESEKKLLLNRSSRGSLSMQRDAPSLPTGMEVKPSSGTVSESSFRSDSDELVPLAPVLPSQDDADGEIVGIDDFLKQEVEKTPKKTSNSRALGKPVLGTNENPVTSLISMSDRGQSLVQNEGVITIVDKPVATTVPSNPVELDTRTKRDGAATYTLTAITDTPTAAPHETFQHSAFDSEMAELQSALAAAGLPQIVSVGYSSSKDVNTSSQHERMGTVEESPPADHPAAKKSLQEVIRAITAEELTSASREILGGSLMEKTPKLSKVVQKEKPVGTARREKGKTSGTSKHPQSSTRRTSSLSSGSSRDSLNVQASRSSGINVKRQITNTTGHSRSKPNVKTPSGQLVNKKSKPSSQVSSNSKSPEVSKPLEAASCNSKLIQAAKSNKSNKVAIPILSKSRPEQVVEILPDSSLPLVKETSTEISSTDQQQITYPTKEVCD